MARFKSEGFERLIDDLERLEIDTGELGKRILMESAAVVKNCWQNQIRRFKLIDTGAMVNSIGFSRKPRKVRDILSIDIYPQGREPDTVSKRDGHVIKGTRNSEKAFILHYGTSEKPGTYFVDAADAEAGPEVEKVARDVYDQWLNEHDF